MELYLFLEMGTGEGYSHLSIVYCLSLKFSHYEETLEKCVKLCQTHPFILRILLPLCLSDWAIELKAKPTELFLARWMEHSQIQYFRRWIIIRRSGLPFTFVLVLLFIQIQLAKNKRFIMRKENFKAGFSIIYLILCLNGIQKKLEFYKCAIFFLDKDNFSDPPEIRKDIVNTIVVILHRE